MTAAFFDTDAYTHRLIEGGMSPGAAAVEAEIMLGVMERIHRIEAASIILAVEHRRFNEKLDSNSEVFDIELRFIDTVRRSQIEGLRFEMQSWMHRELMKNNIWTAFVVLISWLIVLFTVPALIAHAR